MKKGTEKTVAIKVMITEIEPNRQQPRKSFDEEALQELADSIKEYGVLQPLLVQKENDYYKIIAGERRWRAAKKAGLKEIPVIIKDYTPQQMVETSLIENIQRKDLNPIEEAMAYKRLIEEFHLTQEELSKRLSKSRVAVTNSMRLLKLDGRVQEMLIENRITGGHARSLLSIEDFDEQYQLAMKIFHEGLSVRETERFVKQFLESKKEKNTKKKTQLTDGEKLAYCNIEEKLRNFLGTKVQIQRKDKSKGKIEIEYGSKEELERLVELLIQSNR